MRQLGFAIFLSLLPSPLLAFQDVRDEQGFVALVSGKSLVRTGITLTVGPDGSIKGRAFGRAVRGEWSWRAGYFCRDLYWGRRALGYNCQSVLIDGGVLRFVSDRGKGPFADLRLR